jgi:tetratricopeptide (TPR) repeat protein/predicted Ser/Thr protein kinase
MSGLIPAHWMDRVSESLREHEDRQSSMQGAPPRYEVLSEISRGGMGIVYRAWDPQLGRNVALKVLRPEEGRDAEVHERFQREAKLAAGLHHPHIVQVFDTGTWNGQNYIAMQLIEGTTLDQAKPDRKQALACIRDAARALHFAHEQGIVHRDVKPGNLLVDGTGRVFVSDFGVARLAVVSATITSPGTVVGTPAYMSPEQAQGLPTDARSDVYSLGATLYELVTGRPPIGGTDPLEVIEAVRTRDPEPPRKVAPDLSKNVEAIILGAMERARDERYPSAAKLADDIDRYLKGERPLRRPRGMTYRVRREFVRHPWRSTAAIVLCALLLLAGAFVGYWIRGYVYLHRARQATSSELRKKYFKIAEPWFPEAGQALADIQEEEKKVALEQARQVADQQLQAQRKKDAEDQQKIREERDEDKRRYLINQIDLSARKHLDDGKLEDARKAIDALLTRAPEKYAELLPKLRKAEFNSGIERLAELAFKANESDFAPIYKVLSSSPYELIPDVKVRLSKPVFDLAIALKEKGSLRPALNWFGEAESLGLQEAKLYEQRGLILVKLEQWEPAQRDFNVLRGRNPDATVALPFAELPYQKGRAALLDHRWTEAIGLFADALNINSRHALALHDRGIARFRSLGLAFEALEDDLKKALTCDPTLKPRPDYRDVALAFARAEGEKHWKDEKAEERAAAWTRAVTWLTLIMEKTSPGDPDLLLERSKMWRRQGDLPQALSDALQADRIRSDVESRLTLGIISYLQAHALNKSDAQTQEAITHLDRAGQLAPADPRIPYWRGLCRRSLGPRELDAALKDFLEARELKMGLPHLFVVTAKTRLDIITRDDDKKSWAAPADDATRAITGAELLYEDEYVAALYEQRQIPQSQAVRHLSRDGHLFKAEALNYGSQFGASIDECSAALRNDPQSANAYLWRGYSRFEDKRYKEAQEDFRQVLRLSTHPDEKKNATNWLALCQKYVKD